MFKIKNRIWLEKIVLLETSKYTKTNVESDVLNVARFLTPNQNCYELRKKKVQFETEIILCWYILELATKIAMLSLQP